MSLIYLDYNRTTPLAPSVLEAMQPFWSTHFMLPGQEHPHAQAVGESLEAAREGVSFLVGCEPFEIVFTSGGTESNNLGILGSFGCGPPGHALVSDLEHQSVIDAVAKLTLAGWKVGSLPCAANGQIDPQEVSSRLQDDTKLVCVQLANPILGTIQPVREIADACHKRGAMLHCDATQAFGKIPVDAAQLGADTISISGHKFYGPKGSGALFIRRGLALSPITYGEPREMGLRPGAENIPACVGIGAAASLASRGISDAESNLGELRERLTKGLEQTISPAPKFLCSQAPRLPNTFAIELPTSARQVQRAARHIAVSTAQSNTPPDEMTRALRAIGCSDSQIGRTLAISVGWTTTRDQIDRAIELLADACDTHSLP
ncbi:MAG: cysteine desulfurase family protein [Verrucomicrobiales bacterium]